jgi:hypothetical protein
MNNLSCREPSAGELEFIGNNCARPPKAHDLLTVPARIHPSR